MNKKDIDKMIRWACDTDGHQFAKDIYQRAESDEYTIGKFKSMQSYFIHWVANLDGGNRQRLADAINNSHPTIEREFRDDVEVLNLTDEEKYEIETIHKLRKKFYNKYISEEK